GDRFRALGVASARRSTERLLECGRRHLFEPEAEDVAMRAETIEGPGEVRLRGDAESAAGRDDPEEDARAMRALGAAGEEHVEAELGDVLELVLGGGVVDRDVGIVDEAEE